MAGLGPLTDSTNHINNGNRSSSISGGGGKKEEQHPPPCGDKENAAPPPDGRQKQQLLRGPRSVCGGISTWAALKPSSSSLQLCMQMNNSEPSIGCSDHSAQLKIWDWDFSDSEAAPASSWSSLPNRALLCRPLPLDVGRCTCVVVKEAAPQGLGGGSLYSLNTNEGHGRQNRKLAVAHHKRHHGKSEFKVAQSLKGLLSISDDSFIGIVTANLVGSKYLVWDQGGHVSSSTRHNDALAAVVRFMPTMATWTGSHRSMRVHLQPKNATQMKHINGLPKDRAEKNDKMHQLYSRIPHYNSVSKQYELDFRDGGRAGLKIQRSVKNFQLTLEENGKQTVLQLGRVGKDKFVMDFRYPLTGYQAFCICLASIDSKLCCTM